MFIAVYCAAVSQTSDLIWVDYSPKKGLCKSTWNQVSSQMAMGQQPVPPVNIPIPTKMKPKMGGAPTPNWYPIGFDPQPNGDSSRSCAFGVSMLVREKPQNDGICSKGECFSFFAGASTGKLPAAAPAGASRRLKAKPAEGAVAQRM